MEHQELEPLATALLPLDVDGDDDDEEYKVESDAEADDTESDEGDEQDLHPQEEDTLHLLDIADDLLGNLDEDVLSDSECVESDSEDDDEEGCTGVAAAISSPQQQSPGEIDKHAAVRMSQQEQPTHKASARRAQQAGLQDVGRNPDESFAAQQSTLLRLRCEAPLCSEGRQQQQWIPQRDADCSPNWDAASSGMAATPVLHGRQDTQKAGNGGTLSMITAAAATGPVEIATPLAPGPGTQKDPDGSPCRTRGNAQMQEQPLNGQASWLCGVNRANPGGLRAQQQDKPHGQMHGQDRPQEHGQVIYPPSGGICRRTRTHVSLRDVDLSELEQQLPEHIDLEEIELAEDDEEYGKFLQTLFDDTAALPEDSSDEDPDFAADLDLDLDKASKDDDDDDDRGWLKLLNPPEREGSRNMTIRGEPTEDSPARRTRARSKRGSAKGGAAGASESGEAGGVLEMTAEQLSVLHAQVHCHTQLLLQTYLMFATDTDSEAHDLAMKAKAMLEQLAMCRDAQSTTRRLLGFASYAPEDLLRPAAVAQPLSANTAPVASTGLATSGGAHGDRPATSGSAEGGDAAAATASSCAGGLANELRRADAWGCGRALTQPRGLQHTQGQLPAGIPMAATATAAIGITTYTQGHSEISQDEISMGGNEWDGDPTIGSAAAGMPAVKAAAAARSASLNAAILAFRPTWCPGPEGGVWSVLDVVPLRKFPEVQGVLQTLPAMPYSTMKLQRDLQAIAKSKRKKRRRRMDDPLLAALDWARPALQCLQSHLLTALMYHPSPPVPPSYWTFAEDDLMMYGMSRHGTNWRLIAKTLLVTRNASQIANRYKNLNARRRMPEEHMDDGRAEEQQIQALPTTAPGVAGGSAARKPKSGPAARPKAPGPAPGPGVGVGIGQAAGSSALTRPNTLQVAAALPVATGLAGAGANTAAAATVASAAALLTQPMLPELAAMVHSARIVGLPPAVAAAHIMQAQQQLRPHLQPPPQAALPQVPFSVAVQLLQMAKAGGMTGPGAAAARLLAAQLQEPHTAMAVISALQSATHQAQPIDSAGVLSAAATAAAASHVTATGPTAGGTEGLGGLLSGTGAAGQSGGTGSAGCLDGAVDLGVPSILAQLLQARLATNNAAALGATLTQQASQVASKLFLQAGAPGGVAQPLPLSIGAAQQALLSLRQTTASLPVGINAVPTNAQGEGPAAAVAAVGSAAIAEPQPVAKKDQSDVAVGEVVCNGSSVVIPVAQHRPAGAAALLSDGAAKPIGAPRPWQEHDCEQNDPMHWTLQSSSSPSCPVARGNGGGDCASGVHATVVAVVAAPPREGGEAGLGIDLPRKSVAMAAAAPWQQPAHCGLQEDPPCSVLTRSMAVTDVLLAAEAGGAAADAVLHTGPTDPRLSHGKELPGHHPQQRAHFPPQSRNLNDLPHQQQQQQGHYQRGEVSPGEQFLHHGPHHNHDLQGHQQQAHHDLPSLSDNFTLGGISELLGHGALKSGAATPATCVSPQGGLTSVCLSHGHTMSLLLGSALGLSALLRSDADGDSVTSTKSAAGGPLRADEPLCENDQAHRSPCGRQVPGSPCEPQTKQIGDVNADGANALEVMVATLRTPGGKNQPGATAPPPPSRLLTPQRFSPNSPTDAEDAACLKGREAAFPPRIAALRGLDLTPSSDPKARRRSRIGTVEHAAGRTMLHALAPSPFEGTAQNHREGRGEKNGATAASYCPRPPLFAEEPGAEGQHFRGGCLRLLEGSVIIEEDDEGDAAAEGLARARKRLRLDVEDEVSGAAKVPRPLLFEPFDAATTAAPINVHSLGPVANTVEASPVSLAGAPPASATAAVLVSTGLARTIFGHQPEPQQQRQQLADTGSSGDSKRRSESTDMTSGGGSKRVRPGQASGRLESDGADAAAAGRGPGRRGQMVEAVAAPDMTAKEAATDQVCGGRDTGLQQRPGTGHQLCRVAGQKRSRSGAGQKPVTFDKDGAAWVAASGPLCLPLAAADTNTNARTTEAAVAGPAVSPSGSCAVAGVSAVTTKISMKHHNPCIPPTAAGDAETASRAATGGISVKPAGGAQTGLVAKPPKAPTRKGAGWAQRLTRVSAAAGARPVPSTRQRRPSEPNGARFGSTVPASAPPSTCTSPETSRATHVAAMAAISSSPRSLHMLLAPGSAADSEVSSGGMSLHSLLCSADTLDIASLLPSMSTRSLAAAVVNVCSPTSRPDTGIASAAAEKPAAPVTRSSHNPVDMAAPVLAAANSSAGVGPNADASLTTVAAAGLSTFMSPPRSQLMQLTPFAHSGCTLGSSDILPLFSNSTDLWNALQMGSALGTTSRGPEARVVAGSTAAGDGSGEGPNGPSEAPSSITPLDPWSRFMASCSPAETQEEAALLPSCHEYSLSAFHTFLASIAGPRNTVADATVTMVAAATTTATEQAVIKESSVSEPGQWGVRNGTGTGNRGAAAGVCVAGPIVAGDQASGDVTPAAPPGTAAVVVVVAGGASSCQKLSRPENASGLPPLEVATRATGPSGAEAQPTGALEASGDVHSQQPRAGEAVAGVPLDGKASAGLDSPGPHQHHAPDTCAAAVAISKPVGGTAGTAYEGLLPPLPPAFSRHGSAPSPVAQPPPDSRPPAPETVRLFGRTVAKPLPIASPTMPAPLKLLRSPALAAAPPVTAGGAVVRPLQALRHECATAPVHGDSIVPAACDGATDDNSNSRSLTQPETSVVLPPLPLPALVLQTPAHGSPGGSNSLLRRILSPVDAPRVPTQGLFDTPLIATAAAAAAPTPLQPPRAVAAAAVAAMQQTPATVAPAGAFAIPDTHAAVAIAAPLSLTPLPVLDATAIKTVGRRGTWEARRPHAPVGMMGPSISHWASNDHDPVNEPAAPETDIERQASGGWRNAAVPQWQGARTAHMVGCPAVGTSVDTPGHVTCFSKVAQRGRVAVDPLVMPSPSVVQPTPRGRHGEDGEEVVALRAGYSPCREDEYDDREGAGDSLGDGASDANPAGEAGHGVYPCGSPAITVERENGTDSGAEGDAPGEVLASADSPGGHESVAAAVATTNCAGAAVGVAKDPVARLAPVLVAAVPAKEPEPALTTVVATVATAAGPAWSKELDQLVMKEIFRLGEGQSTWRSISDQLGAGVYTAEVVEARGKLLMARMMQLM